MLVGNKIIVYIENNQIIFQVSPKNMPELPEVETIKNAIQQKIGKAVICETIIRNHSLRTPIPEDLPEKINGSRIRKYNRIAKYITIDLSNGLSILWHMGMSGKIRIEKKLPQNFEKHDHIILKTDNGYLIYNDPRRFGLFTYYKTDESHNLSMLKNVGIEPFDEKLDADYLYKKLQRHKTTPIKIALLDQKTISGIGNIYASEILYKSRISPLRNSGDLSLSDCEKIIRNTRIVLQEAIEKGGSTLRDYKKPDGNIGYFQNLHCVYNKTGQKCPDCTCNFAKTKGIKKIVIGGRSTFYCESLQK